MATVGTQVTLDVKTMVSMQLVNSWKDVGRMLLDDGERASSEYECVLDDIDKTYSSEAEKGYQMLQHWQERKGENATVEELAKALRATKHVATANLLQKMVDSLPNAPAYSSTQLTSPTAENFIAQPASKEGLTPKEQIKLNFDRKELVSRSIGIRWIVLAKFLGYSTGECELFEAQGKRADEHCRNMLDHWLKKKKNTYEVLAKTLEEMCEVTLAEKLRNCDFI